MNNHKNGMIRGIVILVLALIMLYMVITKSSVLFG